MVCKYSGYTWSILLGMILTGSARSIVVKLAYQSGFKAPLTITLLYLLGQSFSLIVYGVQKWLANRSNDYAAVSVEKYDVSTLASSQHEKGLELGSYAGVSVASEDCLHDKTPQDASLELELELEASCDVEADMDEKKSDDPESLPMKQKPDSTIATHSGSTGSLSYSKFLSSSSSSLTDTVTPPPPPPPTLSSAILEFYTTALQSFYEDEMPNGSNHGLSRQSEERIKWVHHVPFYAKPAIPAILNLLNSALRWASLVYIDASVAEMMISGLELTLSVVAARIFRKRMVAKSRWMGVIIVAVGVIIIERANNSKHQQTKSEGKDDGGSEVHGGTHDAMIGVILIVLQSILSVLQDLGEEIFMQATDFPATMMLGLEGLYGFCIGFIIYATVGNRLRIEDIGSTISMLSDNARLRWWLVGLPILFLVTGVFNIKATEVTSAMTRNVWKNFRTVLVWTIALGIFYLGNNSAYGEAWHTPESFVILLGFTVMGCGITAYYWFKEQEQSEAMVDTAGPPKP